MRMRLMFLIATLAALMAAPCAVLAQDWFVSPSEPNGHVTGNINKPASGLYRVEITEINGKLVGSGRSGGVWLKPGEYTIKARRADVRGEFTRTVGKSSTDRQKPDSNEIELVVEEGKTYHLALDTNAPRRSDWEIVVWKVE